MPYLKIQTNQTLDQAQQQALMAKASSLLAKQLGKPETYIMVAIEDGHNMLFAGVPEPTAYLELKSIGLPADNTASISAALCNLLAENIGISPSRTYIEFADAARHMWGWNGKTF